MLETSPFCVVYHIMISKDDIFVLLAHAKIQIYYVHSMIIANWYSDSPKYIFIYIDIYVLNYIYRYLLRLTPNLLLHLPRHLLRTLQ